MLSCYGRSGHPSLFDQHTNETHEKLKSATRGCQSQVQFLGAVNELILFVKRGSGADDATESADQQHKISQIGQLLALPIRHQHAHHRSAPAERDEGRRQRQLVNSQ